MSTNTILGIPLEPLSKNEVLEKIKKNIEHPANFYHIVSLNPENLVLTGKNKKFKEVIEKAQIRIIDGVGVSLAARILGVKAGERFPGVDLMEDLIKMASNRRLRVLLIGGSPNLADNLAKCYKRAYPEASFVGIEGFKNIKKQLQEEKKKVFSIVASYKPHLVFASFGSPEQELWLDRHNNEFTSIVCMGVGGGFDYLSGNISRAPQFVRKIGLEWFVRLLVQPWRWRRQLRLLQFIAIVLREKFRTSVDN